MEDVNKCESSYNSPWYCQVHSKPMVVCDALIKFHEKIFQHPEMQRHQCITDASLNSVFREMMA